MQQMTKLRLPILIALATTFGLAAVMVPSGEVSAVPSFARIHKLKCTECHIGFPVLNEFGWEFKQRGYRLKGEEGNYVWDQPLSQLSLLAEVRYLNKHTEDAVTGVRVNNGKGVENKFEFEEIELFAAGTLAPKIGYFVELAAEVAADEPLEFGAGWFMFQDLLPNSMLNLRAGKMDNEFYYLAQARRLTFDGYISPVSLGVTGVELNGYFKRFRYAAGVANDERESGSSTPSVNLDDKLNNFYLWGTYNIFDQILGVRFTNTLANSDNPSTIDGHARKQLDVNTYLRLGPAYVILAYIHNWDIGGVNGQDRRNYLAEAMVELRPEKLFLDTRFELQDTGTVSGSPNNPGTANATHVVAGVRYFLEPNVAIVAEFDKTSGEGGVAEIDGQGATDTSRERYILGLNIGF